MRDFIFFHFNIIIIPSLESSLLMSDSDIDKILLHDFSNI